ncbi:peptidyl-prolyl cis-trans isomerase [Faecalicatena contorta]|uniref:peptidyl-prolyl cis-trans isomerase n=1 Tax=Faecalicatena contorta TaxID=39482 RepID=UPI0017488F9A|nr:peptidyl-prolyl cis-trans isomerase [Faecalicatena contorta]MBM6685083.1 peptidyl-prolyl cis-trans isomerase [Faecalicatena contorta]MBM6710611.1 peptidyl-prolyl cis-trans isomerase [Faecalicatena contorta]
MKKRAVILLLAGLLAAGSLTGCGSLEDSDVVATVNDTDITAGVANFLARYTQAQYETYYAGYMGDDMWSGEGEDGETYQDTVKDSILESLENMYLMEQHMDEYEVSLSDEEKNAIKEAASEFDSANGLSEKEKVSGSTDNVERVLELLTIQKKVQDAIEAGADTEVSDEEAAQKSMQYVVFPFTTTDEEGNSVDLTDEEKEELKATAESFAAGAAGAADFAAYAAQQGQTSQDATFDGETTTLPTQLVEAADALGEGETTGLVEGDNGYYVARVTSLLDREATDAKKQEIVSQRQQELLDDTIDGWREDADIEVHEKVWDKVDFTTLTVTMKQDEADPYTDEVQTDDQAEDAGE